MGALVWFNVCLQKDLLPLCGVLPVDVGVILARCLCHHCHHCHILMIAELLRIVQVLRDLSSSRPWSIIIVIFVIYIKCRLLMYRNLRLYFWGFINIFEIGRQFWADERHYYFFSRSNRNNTSSHPSQKRSWQMTYLGDIGDLASTMSPLRWLWLRWFKIVIPY